MTKLDTQIDSKKNAVAGTLTQAKGVARERWGQATNNSKLQFAGKKDQVVGTLQKNLGDSWAYRNKQFILLGSVVAALAAAVFYFFNRTNDTMATVQPNIY
jgi:uncharacterized protein YjbJ (UPF0337 family)